MSSPSDLLPLVQICLEIMRSTSFSCLTSNFLFLPKTLLCSPRRHFHHTVVVYRFTIVPSHICGQLARIFETCCAQRGHIKVERAWGVKIGLKLKGAILSKSVSKLFFSRPFAVCSRASRSNNWRLGSCFVFVFIKCIAEKAAFLVITRLLLLP